MGEVRAQWMRELSPDWETPVQPASSAGLIEEAVAILGRAPVEWGVQQGHAMAVTIVAEMPLFGGSSTGFEVLRMGTEAATVQALVWLATGSAERRATPESLDGVRDFVRRGIGLDSVLRGVRLGHAQMARGFLAGCERLVAPEERIAEAKRISDELFDYIDAFSRAMSEQYVQEQVHWSTSELAARRSLVMSILRETPSDPASHSRRLQYPFTGTQHGFVFWTDAASSDTNTAEVQRAIAGVFRTLPIANRLVLPVDAGTVWAWATGDPLATDALREAVAGLPREIRVAVGRPAKGLEGFRSSHAQALAAAELTRSTTGLGRTVFYRDVELLSLLLGDRERAVAFASRVLGPLWSARPQMKVLRSTLRCYLEEQGSGQAVARRMHVVRNTVSYRVQRAEELMKQPIAGRTQEVHAALVIADALPCP
ncbi:MAG: PucR family transcriptional regulator [Leucobacter sp.]